MSRERKDNGKQRKSNISYHRRIHKGRCENDLVISSYFRSQFSSRQVSLVSDVVALAPWLLNDDVKFTDAKIDIVEDSDKIYLVWECGMWHSGNWYGGFDDGRDDSSVIIWEDGVWMKGNWYHGIWRGGQWFDGRWFNGDWHDGIWEGGTWVGGRWSDGLWKDGIWESGIWYNGEWLKGRWLDGLWRAGTWKNGEWEYGDWFGGSWIKGKIEGEYSSSHPYREQY